MDNLLDETIKRLSKIHKIEEMARVGSMNGFDFKVYGGEGSYPHIHMDSADKSVYIRLDKCDYFLHNSGPDMLNSNERKILVKFMNTKHKKYNVTYWEYMINLWNENNPEYEIDDTKLKMPDYSKLKVK